MNLLCFFVQVPASLLEQRNLSKSNPDLNLVTTPRVSKPTSLGEDFNKHAELQVNY